MLTEKMEKAAVHAYMDAITADTHGTLTERVTWVYAAVEAALAEEARATERGQHEYVECHCFHCDGDHSTGENKLCAVEGCHRMKSDNIHRQPTQPPVGDVVERMLDAYMPGWKCEPSPERQRKYMAAALAIAREGMVPKSDYDERVRMLRIESEAAQGRESYVSLEACTGCKHTRIAHCNLHKDKWACSECLCKNYMPAIPEGYVSLADMERVIRVEATRVLYGPKAAETFITSVRNRLAKPAEQTDEQKVEAILTKHFHHIGVVDAAAEIVAALRGKEGK